MTSKDFSSLNAKGRDQFSLAVPISFEGGTETTPSYITGYGIHPGLFNGVVEVPRDELDNIEQRLKGKQLRTDHSEEVLDVIGIVVETLKTFDKEAGKEGVQYRAEIDVDDEKALKVLRKIEKGYVNASSLGFFHDSICSICGEDYHECEHWWSDGAHVIAKNCEPFEISVVTLGADGDATAAVSGLSKKFADKFKSQFESKLTKLNNKGGKVMEPKEEKQAPQVFEPGKLVEQLAQAQADALTKEKEISALKAQMTEQKEALDKLIKSKENEDEAESTEVTELKKENEKLQKSLEKINGEVTKDVVTKLVERQVAVGLIKEDEAEAEIEILSKAGEETIQIQTATVEKLEAQKLAREQEEKKQEPKVPEFNALVKDGKKEIDIFSDEVQQYLAHSVFNYDTVFQGEERGHNYMGGKKK